MAIRTYQAADGTTWTVWLVQTTLGTMPGAPTEWLAFQNADGTERRRLLEIPGGWDKLPDERLDLLRRVAEPVKGWTERHTPPGGVGRQDPASADDSR